MNVFTKYLTPDRVITPLRVSDKEAALRAMSACIAGDDLPAEEVFRGMLLREEDITTGVGYGIAIPHYRCDGKLKLRMGLGVSAIPLEWESFDDRPVRLIFATLGSLEDKDELLELFSQLMGYLRSADLRQQMTAASDPRTLFKILESIETLPQP